MRALLLCALVAAAAAATITLEDTSYVLALPSMNHEKVHDLLMEISDPESPKYGQTFTHDEIRALTDAPQSMRDEIMQWLSEHDFTDAKDLGDAIEFNAPSIEHAMLNLLEEREEGYGDDEERILHPDLTDLGCLFVEGTGMAVPNAIRELRKRKVHTPDQVGGEPFSNGIVGRQTLEYLYQIHHNTVSPKNAASSSVAAIEYLNYPGFSAADLASAQKANGWPLNPIETNHIIGVNNGEGGESELDVQIMAAVMSDFQQWFWTSSGWLFKLASSVYNHASPPQVLSNSYGWDAKNQCRWAGCPPSGNTAYVQRVNKEYAKLGMKRITVVVASGDAGAPGRMNEQCSESLGVIAAYPASSPYVLAVGGTYVSAAKGTVDINKVTKPTPLCTNPSMNHYGCANGTGEGQTNFNESFLPIRWTAGGGFAYGFELDGMAGPPAWQKKFVEAYLASGTTLPKPEWGFNRTSRAYPDVSANSNLCAVFRNGQVFPEAGTSCACPIVAGIVGLLNHNLKSKGKPFVGFVNPALYKLADKSTDAFNRVGNNPAKPFHKTIPSNNGCSEFQCCPRGPNGQTLGYYSNPKADGKYDPVNGLGTPNYAAWYNYFSSL